MLLFDAQEPKANWTITDQALLQQGQGSNEACRPLQNQQHAGQADFSLAGYGMRGGQYTFNFDGDAHATGQSSAAFWDD